MTSSAAADSNMGGVLGAVAAAWERARPTLLQRLEALEDLAADVLGDQADPSALRAGERIAHQLAGSLGMFGLPQGTEMASRVEHLLGTPSTDPQQGRVLAELVTGLRTAVENHALSLTPSQRQAVHATLLVLSRDADAVRLLTDGFSTRLAVRTVEDTVAASRVLRELDVGLAALDLDLDPTAVEDLLREISRTHPLVPTLVLSGTDRVASRVSASQAGADAYVSKLQPPRQVVEAAERLIGRRGKRGELVLALDDDPAVLATLERLLGAVGLRVLTMTAAGRLWHELDIALPDLVILDLDLPDVGGTDICRALRADSRYAALPVLFLTVSDGAEAVQEVIAAGADDFVRKPIIGAELLTRVENRLERLRLYRERFDIDAVTGLYSRAKGEEEMRHLISIAQQSGDPVAVGVFDLDRFKQINDRYGHPTGDDVLRRLSWLLKAGLRHDDVVARWGGAEFLIAMRGIGCDGGTARLTDLLGHWRATSLTSADGQLFSSSFSAGVAELPADGTDLGSLYRAADAAMFRAKSYGQGRVVTASWRPTSGDASVDVCLVEDDPMVLEIIADALSERGLSVRSIPDGKEAAHLLCGAAPALSARVLLLDIDLPGLDGLAVLRELAADGRLEHLRTIMLSDRSEEGNAAEALRLGAVDYVHKPVSIPVLMKRVTTALASR